MRATSIIACDVASIGCHTDLWAPAPRRLSSLVRKAGWEGLIAPIRSAVERTFGTLKRGYGYGRVRYRGVLPNHVHLQLLCSALNLRRAAVLCA